MTWLPSERFRIAAHAAWQQVLDPSITRDDALRWMALHIPLYLAPEATPEQAAEAGCPWCTYLGMWSPGWPGFPSSPHGIILLYENGISQMPGDLVANTYQVLTHEMGHALQRDHVLDAMERERQQGQRGLIQTPGPRGCGCPGQH